MDPVIVKRLRLVVWGTYVDHVQASTNARASCGFEPLTIEVKRDALMQQVRAKPRHMVPKEREWLESRMLQLQAAALVRLNRQITCASGALATSKGREFRMMVDYFVADA